MKKFIKVFTLLIWVTGFCQAQEDHNIDLNKSSIKWMGEYTFYFGGHEGTIDFKEGYLILSSSKITGGSFIIDMKTMKNTDL